MKKVYVNEKWCLGCHLCEYYCAFAGTNEKNMARALRDIKINPKINIEEKNGVSFAVSCRHCREPLCVKGCITGALTIVNGVITTNSDKCVSCYACILSCPYGAISPSDDGAVQKCELCVKTSAGTPACVKGCPNGAIVFEDRGGAVENNVAAENYSAQKTRTKHVIIGNSAAGVGAVEGIRKVDKEAEITIITNEPHHTYSRPLISYLILGKVGADKMKYRSDSFYKDNNCSVVHANAVKINADTKEVVLDNGERVPYDKLLTAAGSVPFIPPFNGVDTVKDKFTFMSLDDAIKLNAAVKNDKRVLIIGAGLIGLKCAESISAKAAQITVLDLAPKVLSSILDEDGAKIVQTHIERNGIKFKLSANVKSIYNNTVTLDNGDTIEFDLLVLAVGVRPNTELLNGIAKIDRGIVINERSETSAPDVYAAGDCTQTLDVSSGQNRIMALLPNAYMQGECAGINMASGEKNFSNAIPMNAIGFFGLHIITAGNYEGDVYAETKDGGYKRLFYKDDRLNGCILIGNVEKAGIYASLIRERTPLHTIDFELVCEKPGLMAFTKEDRMVKLGEAK